VTETRTREHASGPGGGPDPGRANRDGRASGLNIRIIPGGYLLAAFAAVVSGLSLPRTGPDGGRIVRALTWARTGNPAKADLVAARAGQGALVLGPDGELAGVVTPADLARAAQLGALRQRSPWAR